MSTAQSTLADRFSQLKDRIHKAADNVGRSPDDILLVAVSKTHSSDRIEQAHELGLRHFGENRVEEAGPKVSALSHLPDINWHMVGHIQSRKAKDVPGTFSIAHSIDRLKIADRLNRSALRQETSLDVLLEVNLSGEESKHGFRLEQSLRDKQQLDLFTQDVAAILKLPALRVVGLMTMAPFSSNPENSRPVFASLAQLRAIIADRFTAQAWTHLSMGMSGDFEIAIQEGATMLRIGTALFGATMLRVGTALFGSRQY